MAYVATRGGEGAILNAEALYRELCGDFSGEFISQITQNLPMLVDRVMGEGSLYSPELAALALAQSGGDLYEAILLLRAYRTTQPRIAYAQPLEANKLTVVRRISAAFKDIPGGQVLGPTLDYSHRVLQLDKLNVQPGLSQSQNENPVSSSKHSFSGKIPFIADHLRVSGLLKPVVPDQTTAEEIPDITREPVLFPAPRAHRLQSLARADTGGVLALGYSGMRSYGNGGVHPTVNELRLAYAEVELVHPVTGAVFSAGRVRMSQAEVVVKGASADGGLELSLGYSATLGWNETKVISGAMLDMQMNQTHPHPAHAEEFVMYHTEPVESSGFCIHYKLPHYVTFSSSLDTLRQANKKSNLKKNLPLEEVSP